MPQRPQLSGSDFTCTHFEPHRVEWPGQPQRFLPFLRAGGRQTSPAGQHLPAQRTRCFGQWPVAAASASAGVVSTAPTNTAPPFCKASRRDIPVARPRAIVSIVFPEARSDRNQPNGISVD